ncbi:MAG: glycerol dehydrogenase [Bacteroidia bacterium]|nr:glycerol dehydrogenase [Bacteroidia bacterium]
MFIKAVFPGKYIQGRGVLHELPDLVKPLGIKGMILASPTVKEKILPVYGSASIKDQFKVELFKGECCEKEINRLCQIIRNDSLDIIIGMGGGKTIDTAKIAADRAGIPVVIVPTIAASDAPCSGCAVMYTDEGVFKAVYYQKMNPAAVLVDMDIIAGAPTRFLVSGMGDALAANILLSGIGFESSGLAAAHAIHNGLTALEETHSYYHGEKVAFGVLTGLQLTSAQPEEVDRVYSFCKEVGLPLTFEDIGLNNPTRSKLMIAAEKSCTPGEAIHHEAGKITPDKVLNAMIMADAIGKARKSSPISERSEHNYL